MVISDMNFIQFQNFHIDLNMYEAGLIFRNKCTIQLFMTLLFLLIFYMNINRVLLKAPFQELFLTHRHFSKLYPKFIINVREEKKI